MKNLTESEPLILERKWITKEEAIKFWPLPEKITDSALDCTKQDCRCKTRKKEKGR